MKTLALVPLLLLAACSKGAAAPTPEPQAMTDGGTPAGGTKAETPLDSVAAMNAAIDTCMAKPEHKDAEVTIQHCLVGVVGAGLPGVTRTPGEAETLTADLYARTLAGEDFDAIVKNNTNDSHPGIYSMSLGQPSTAGVYPRSGMVAGFGDVAWRLSVGEIGIARFDGGIPGSDPKSPFGYHIIKRLK